MCFFHKRTWPSNKKASLETWMINMDDLWMISSLQLVNPTRLKHQISPPYWWIVVAMIVLWRLRKPTACWPKKTGQLMNKWVPKWSKHVQTKVQLPNSVHVPFGVHSGWLPGHPKASASCCSSLGFLGRWDSRLVGNLSPKEIKKMRVRSAGEDQQLI